MLYVEIANSILLGNAEKTVTLTKKALAQGYPAEAILKKGIIKAINIIAEKYREQRVMVPEALMTSRAVNAALVIIEPNLRQGNKRRTCKVVMGTVAGDLHDIGLNLVKIMVMTTGAKIINLGVDVTPAKFVNAVKKEQPNILMMSALLTTTMHVMREVIEELQITEVRKGLLVIVGGAPLDAVFAGKIGADYYFEDAFQVRLFLEENMGRIIQLKQNRIP